MGLLLKESLQDVAKKKPPVICNGFIEKYHFKKGCMGIAAFYDFRFEYCTFEELEVENLMNMLRGNSFFGCQFKMCDFSKITFELCLFVTSTFEKCNLSDIVFRSRVAHTSFIGCNLWSIWLASASISYCTFEGCIFGDTLFRGWGYQSAICCTTFKECKNIYIFKVGYESVLAFYNEECYELYRHGLYQLGWVSPKSGYRASDLAPDDDFSLSLFRRVADELCDIENGKQSTCVSDKFADWFFPSKIPTRTDASPTEDDN